MEFEVHCAVVLADTVAGAMILAAPDSGRLTSIYLATE